MANQVAGSQTKLAADVEALNSKFTLKTYNTAEALGITSDYTIREIRVRKYGRLIQTAIHINNSGNAFPTGRFTLLQWTSDILHPIMTISFVVPASTGINLYVNRSATGVLTTNSVLIDSLSNSDVREIILQIVYISNTEN